MVAYRQFEEFGMPRSKFCWDSVVFSKVLNGGEGLTADEISGLGEVVDLADRGQIVIVTSALIDMEVLGEIGDETIRARTAHLFERANVVSVEPASTIISRARQIREQGRLEGRSIKTPDAIFIATAIVHGANAFHTFDDKLLAISGKDYVDALPITKPRGEQTLLAL